jgi:cellulose synthase/poly-beta-1,6-N-acetylglucosamine synthase-like glycosyltransferase
MVDDPFGVRVGPLPLPLSGLVASIRLGFVVAIPVRNEEERLPACLRALAQQRDRSGQPIPPALVSIVVFANNCSDHSASLARSLGECWSLTIRVVEASFPPATAHAGNARRTAMDIAEAWLEERGESDGVILTTDADSQVGPNWIAENLAAIEAGAEAVLGRINLDGEGKYLPQALHRRGRLEDAYERLLTELFWLLDPLDYNPWPHHATISGASLAITRTAYCRVGRLPRVPLGEDKALVALLSRQDARIRYCPHVHVTTSGRTSGRAPGGVADTLLLRSKEPEAFCDEALEGLSH